MTIIDQKPANEDELAAYLEPSFQVLRDSADFTDDVPDTDLVVELTAGLFTSRGDNLRVRANPAKGASNAVRAAHQLYRWHRSGGNLHGLYGARWTAGELFQAVDTYIQVLNLLNGRQSTAIDAWKRTGLFQ